MAAADKARFYLEQSIPELHEYEKKKVFNKVTLTRRFPVPPPTTSEKHTDPPGAGGDRRDNQETQRL